MNGQILVIANVVGEGRHEMMRGPLYLPCVPRRGEELVFEGVRFRVVTVGYEPTRSGAEVAVVVFSTTVLEDESFDTAVERMKWLGMEKSQVSRKYGDIRRLCYNADGQLN